VREAGPAFRRMKKLRIRRRTAFMLCEQEQGSASLAPLPQRSLVPSVPCSPSHGFCSIETFTIEVFPEAARPTRFVATPGRAAGTNVTEPSTAEVAVEACVARSAPGGQTMLGEQGGVHA